MRRFLLGEAYRNASQPLRSDVRSALFTILGLNPLFVRVQNRRVLHRPCMYGFCRVAGVGACKPWIRVDLMGKKKA